MVLLGHTTFFIFIIKASLTSLTQTFLAWSIVHRKSIGMPSFKHLFSLGLYNPVFT